jgi:hypothetical protein
LPFHFFDPLLEHGLQIFVQGGALIEVALRFSLLPLQPPRHAAMQPGFGQMWVECDGLVVVSHGTVQIAFGLLEDAAIVIERGPVWF